MGDGEGRMFVHMAVREVATVVPAVVSEARTELVAKHGDAAMGILSPVGKASNCFLLDLVAGALIFVPAINNNAKSISKETHCTNISPLVQNTVRSPIVVASTNKEFVDLIQFPIIHEDHWLQNSEVLKAFFKKKFQKVDLFFYRDPEEAKEQEEEEAGLGPEYAAVKYGPAPTDNWVERFTLLRSLLH
ncbi:hypothetical protein E2562_020066 [Oryza meyeriana var. granulata]|uniref:Uncharacterized protein n=1 Tax=Oryza meyeriana var. granulata TaxID=110450 RepID=A0A6G1BZZ4_9ORYZ|nr:hypothetical protein E2562_020066 [Oryza meyeriana var. granulata]